MCALSAVSPLRGPGGQEAGTSCTCSAPVWLGSGSHPQADQAGSPGPSPLWPPGGRLHWPVLAFTGLLPPRPWTLRLVTGFQLHILERKFKQKISASQEILQTSTAPTGKGSFSGKRLVSLKRFISSNKTTSLSHPGIPRTPAATTRLC